MRIFGVASVHNWYCSWIIWSLITILWLSYFHFIFLQILYATIVQCYCFSICPVTPQPIERHELRQGHFFLCKMYIPSLTCWLPDMWVFSLSSISRFLWHWRRKALTRQKVTCEFVAFLCNRRSMWRVMSWEKLIVGMVTMCHASSNGLCRKTSALFARPLPCPSIYG